MAETAKTGRRSAATNRSMPLQRRRNGPAHRAQHIVIVREYRRPSAEPPRPFEPDVQFGVSQPLDVVDLIGRCELDDGSERQSDTP